MTNSTQPYGTLKVVVKVHESSSDSIPKQIQVLGSDMTVQKTDWMKGKTWGGSFSSGVYMVRMHLASGKQIEQVAHIDAGKETTLDFDLSPFSPRESQEWMYFTKSNSGDNPIPSPQKPGFSTRAVNKKPSVNVSVYQWQFLANAWHIQLMSVFAVGNINEVGESFSLHIPQGLHVFEVRNHDQPSIFVSVPPGDVKCMIKVAEGPLSMVPALDVSISSANEKAQALLGLISSGDISRAKSLDEAEDLLYKKIEDPASAAIGGYFLLKTGKLEKMHDWANNLADLFSWMSDGCVIHAWQLIQQDQKVYGPLNITLIRQRLLEAVQRGIPIYSEGLRLLNEGLMMLSFDLKGDADIEAALKKIKSYLCYADLSQETTTFTGTSPDEPGAGRV